MKDILSSLDDLRRPGLLISTARIGAQDYRRGAHLARLIGGTPPVSSGAALMQLMELEAELDDCRKNERAGYSPAHHVGILIAMIGEARLLRQAHPA